LHEECRRIFRAEKTPQDIGKAMRLHQHQEERSAPLNAAKAMNLSH
jgi:hypothetical protein